MRCALGFNLSLALLSLDPELAPKAIEALHTSALETSLPDTHPARRRVRAALHRMLQEEEEGGVAEGASRREPPPTRRSFAAPHGPVETFLVCAATANREDTSPYAHHGDLSERAEAGGGIGGGVDSGFTALRGGEALDEALDRLGAGMSFEEEVGVGAGWDASFLPPEEIQNKDSKAVELLSGHRGERRLRWAS